MRVRLLTSIGGTPSYSQGEIVALDDRIAAVWIADGLAEPLADVETDQPLETTMVAPPETTMRDPARARKARR